MGGRDTGRRARRGLAWVGHLLTARQIPCRARAAFPRAHRAGPGPAREHLNPPGGAAAPAPPRARPAPTGPRRRRARAARGPQGPMQQIMKFLQLFGRLKAVVIGMVHVKALPGTPRSTLPLAQITEEACREAEIYKAAGIDGLIVENMHDRPYTASVGAEVTAAMAVICSHVKQVCPFLPVGVQILCAANQQALAVALAAGLDFIRAEGFIFSHVADEGILNACAGDLLRYRKQIGAEHIQVFADIKKKHSSHALTADVNVVETAKAAEFFLADGIVLTGTATGLEADPKELAEVGHAVEIPVLIGSGVTLLNVEDYLSANALIIGSYFKKEGYWANSIDPDRVKRFMDYIAQLRE